MKRKMLIPLLFAIIVGIMGMQIFSVSAGITAEKDDFVKVAGTQFVLNDKPFYFQGNNAFNIAYGHSDYELDSFMSENKNKGIKVIRLWGFGRGFAVEKLDNVIKYAKKYQIKLLIPLTNNWNDVGGDIQSYVDRNGGGSSTRFYTDEVVIKDYQKYVRSVVSRYVNETAILAWELANEPTAPGHTNSQGRYQPWDYTGDKINKWMRLMSDYIRSIDPNHMIASGEEGFMNDRPNYLSDQWDNGEFTDNGTKSLDFSKNVALPNISFASVHIYPDSWISKNGVHTEKYGFGTNAMIEWIDWYLTTRAEIAHKAPNSAGGVGKPIVLGEYGRLGTNPDRNVCYKHWLETCIKNNYAGMAIWQMEGYNIGGDTRGFAFGFNDPTASVIKECADRMNALSAVVTNPSTEEIDSFEGYNGSIEALQAMYQKNKNGNNITLELSDSIKSEGKYGLKYSYTIGSPDYAGVTKKLNQGNFTNYKGIKFWLKTEKSDHVLTIQMKEKSGEYWESKMSLAESIEKTIEIPFDTFKNPEWQTTVGNNQLDLTTISEVSIYANQGTGTEGSYIMYFDAIAPYK